MSHLPDELIALYVSLADAGERDDLDEHWTFEAADAHVRSCRRCRRHAADWRRSLSAWRATDVVDGLPDDAFFEALAEEIDDALGPDIAPLRPARDLRPLLALAAAVALAGALLALASLPRGPVDAVAEAPVEAPPGAVPDSPDDELAAQARAAGRPLLAEALAEPSSPDWSVDLLAEADDELAPTTTGLADQLDALDGDTLRRLAARL